MFRKIVSNIAFSPALVGQLSFYAKRLRKEELTRRLGLIFTALALVVQSLAVFSPPEAANASSSADFVRGGVSSVSDFLRYYDNNHNDIKAIFNSLGITRAEIASAKPGKIGESGRYNWSKTSLYSHAQGQRAWSYGNGKQAYYRPMHLTQQGGNTHQIFYAYSAEQGWFAIKKDCGNLVTDKPPHAPQPVALCSSLVITPLFSTRFQFDGKTSTKNNATISGYQYRVYNQAGVNVGTLNSQSTQLTNRVTYDQKTPGAYTVRLFVASSTGTLQDQKCIGRFTVSQQPVAACIAVKAAIIDRTTVSLSGGATASAGATIQQYIFTVKDKSGKVLKTISVDSAKPSVTAPSFVLTTEGEYTVELNVKTSVGSRTNTDCVTKFTVTEEEKCPVNPSLPVNSPECQPCPENPDVWIKDERCTAEVINTKSSRNLTQGNVDATTTVARAGDKLTYTLTVQNIGLAASKTTIKESLTDVLEYATVIDAGGGTFNKVDKTLNWKEFELPAGESQSRTFVVQILGEIPLTNTGTSDEASYDCMMVNTFGNATEVKIDCPVVKEIVENTVAELPQTGPRENMIFGSTLLALVVYFYARSRQLGKEVRLVRRNVNAGAF